MKLYYAPGACSLSPHIVLRELGLKFDLERVDLKARKTASGKDFLKINPKGYVPALELEDGTVLTEGAAIVQFLADRKPDTGLAPAPGSLARVRLQEQLNFLASELHKAFSPLFNPATPEDVKATARDRVARRFDDLENLLGDGRSYLMGEGYSVADAYLFVLASWTKPTGIDLSRWPKVKALVQRIAQRPPVTEALRAEGLS